MKRGILVLLLVTLSMSTDAEPPQFVLLMTECTTSAGFLTAPHLGIQTIPGDRTMNICSRMTEKTIFCEVSMPDGGGGVKGNTVTYRVLLDSPPILQFADESGADWFMVHTANHVAVVVTRIVTADFVGAKVCHGMFATRSELEAMERE